VRLTRLVTVLMASGLALLALAVALSLMTAAAATGDARYDTTDYRYTDKPSAVAMVARTLTIYIDGDFATAERERIELALRQWNHVLNGFVRLRPVLLPLTRPTAPWRSSAVRAPGSSPRSTAAIPPRAIAARLP